MMVDFKAKFNNYIKSVSANILGISNTKGNGVNFIKAALMSVFDGNNSANGYKDGKIDAKEFYNINEKEYENIVKQMQSFYKAQNNRELEYHIPTYNEIEQMLLKGRDPSVQSQPKNKLLPEQITLKDIEEPIVPNQTIGQVNQESSGECYQDASDIALSFKERGAKLLNRSVKPNLIDGGYDVTLYGAKKDGKTRPVTYHFTREQLRDAQAEMVQFKNGTTGKKYSSGDANIVLLDLAVEKYRKENNHKLLYKNTKSVKGFDDYLSSGKIHENLELITGKKGKIITCSNYIEISLDGKKVESHVFSDRKDKKQKINVFLHMFNCNKERRIAGCNFGVTKEGSWREFKKYGLYEGHAFAIADIDMKNGVVYISNSHSTNPSEGKFSETLSTLPLDVFKRYVSSISWIDI